MPMKIQMRNSFYISYNDLLIAGLAFLLGLFLYVRTLAPSLLSADAAEFQTLAYTMGMTHASGYSTYIFFGRLFTFIPIGDIAYRVNLMSAFFGALAVGQVYLLIRFLGGLKIAGFAGSLALALNPLFWQRTIFAETYAPAASMIASIWLLVLMWRDSKDSRLLFAAGLLGGLSVGIHSTVLMTAISVLIYMLFKARDRRDWLFAAAGTVLGLTLTFLAFLYLDYNNPPSSIYNTAYLTNLSFYGLTLDQFDTPLERLFAIFPAQSFWTYYFSAAPDVIRFRLSEYLNFYPYWEIILILFGAVVLFFYKEKDISLIPEGLYALVAFVITWGFAVTVSFSVYKEFYVPVAVIVHIWLGFGISAFLLGLKKVIGQIKGLKPELSRKAINLLGIVFVAAILIHSRTDINLAIQSGYTTFIRDEHIYPYFLPDRYTRLARRALNKVEDDAIVFAIWDRLYTYVYMAHVIEGRTDIEFHEVWPSLGQDTLDFLESHIDERPIYFTTDHPEISSYYKLEQVGDNLYRLRKKD